MKTTCPNCGATTVVGGLGRKPLNIPVKNVYDALRACSSVQRASEELNCIRAYIYKTFKGQGLNIRQVLESGDKAT